jgi:hypothetical protein
MCHVRKIGIAPRHYEDDLRALAPPNGGHPICQTLRMQHKSRLRRAAEEAKLHAMLAQDHSNEVQAHARLALIHMTQLTADLKRLHVGAISADGRGELP